eukprot:CAMPEP_0197034162 /NCGR_PEP_ID=MMETSP1384-20130603/12349_1 /TAXON_ID=29189 /ORGANISM="Ammonia sp." /LENGTH=327 /DNA_ID=CAMNT_0042464051 /DNA_START=116 /DNA_END=1099 /DNA_ORIENTATION=-
MTCSLSMLLLFAVAVLYLNENYTTISISPIVRMITPTISSTPSDTMHSIPYLHPLAYHSLAYGTCPYTNPTFPSIGPDLSSFCPSNKPMRSATAWYFDKHIRHHIAKDDTQSASDLDNFFKQYETFREIVRNNTNSSDKALEISLKKASGLHLTYQYLSCQTEQEIATLYKHWDGIINDEQVVEMMGNAGGSWQAMEVCFDRVLCMNDNAHGGYAFNLYLDETSQELMRRLVTKTEEIEQEKYAVQLAYRRVRDQQAFHVTLASVTNMEDYDAFDARRLMERVNEEIGSWPCIRLAVAPPFKTEMCYNTKTLQEKQPKFQWKCTDIE